MKKIIYVSIIVGCIIACFILLCLSINNLTKFKKYDKYGYEIKNWKIYKINLAIEENDINKIKKLIKHTNLNVQPLKPLTYQERENIIEEKGLNPDAYPEYLDEDIDYYNFPPLSNACKNRNITAIKLLIENGADVNYLINNDNYNYSPLYTTLNAYINEIYNNGNNLDKYVNIIKLLIDNNVRLDMKTSKNPLLYLTVYSHLEKNDNAVYNSLKIFKLIINNSNEEIPTRIKGDILYYLAMENDVNIIDYLIKSNGWDINTVNSENQNALFGAVIGNDEKTVKYLIDNGINTKKKDNLNETAYDGALRLGMSKKEVLDLLK